MYVEGSFAGSVRNEFIRRVGTDAFFCGIDRLDRGLETVGAGVWFFIP